MQMGTDLAFTRFEKIFKHIYRSFIIRNRIVYYIRWNNTVFIKYFLGKILFFYIFNRYIFGIKRPIPIKFFFGIYNDCNC